MASAALPFFCFPETTRNFPGKDMFPDYCGQLSETVTVPKIFFRIQNLSGIY